MNTNRKETKIWENSLFPVTGFCYFVKRNCEELIIGNFDGGFVKDLEVATKFYALGVYNSLVLWGVYEIFN